MNDVNIVIKQELPTLHAIRVEHINLEAALTDLQYEPQLKISQIIDRKEYITIILAIEGSGRYIQSWIREHMDRWDIRPKEEEQ